MNLRRNRAATRERLRDAAVISLSVFILVVLDPFGLVEQLERKSLDARHRHFAESTPFTEEIVIIDIDEKSIEVLEPLYGRWPWPRSVHGELVRYLKEEGAKVVGFDVLISESARRREVDDAELASIAAEVRSAGSEELRISAASRIAALTAGAADDEFVAGVASAGNVAQAALFYGAADDAAASSGRVFPAHRFREAVMPMEELSRASARIGHVNFTPDPDGPCRRTLPLLEFGPSGELYPSLPLAMASIAFGEPVRTAARLIRIGDVEAPIEEDGTMLIRYQGGRFVGDGGRRRFESYYRAYPYYHALLSIDQIAAGEDPILPRGTFRDKYVLIGTTAAGLKDLRATPFSATSPGVEIHANVLDAILSGRYLRAAPSSLGVALIALACTGVALAAAFSGPWIGFGAGLAAIGAVGGAAWLAFPQGWVFPVSAPLIGGVLSYSGVVLLNYATESRRRRELRSAFGHYLSAAVLEEILRNPDALKLGGQRKYMTVLFADLVGFTSLSEKMTPEEVAGILSEYMTGMVDCILESGGIPDKFIGDAIVAEWNAPLDHPDHAARACECALRMLEELDALRKKWKSEGRPELAVRIGINTGEMVVGNMGSGQGRFSPGLFDYTVIGNEVNTAARLEPLNKEFGTRIVVSAATREEARKFRPDGFFTRRLARVAVIGRAEPIEVYELCGRTSELSESTREALLIYKKGFRAFQERRFAEAREIFRQVEEGIPGDGPSRVYIELCRRYEAEPPPAEWTGVYMQRNK